ncbi:S41 family peptidase [Salinispira pacifica]
MDSDNKKKKREGALWIAGTVLISVISLVLLLAPPVFAQSQDAETQRLLSMFDQVFTFVQNNYVDKVDPHTLVEGALKGLFDSLNDPFSAYLTSDQMRGLTDTTSGEFGGVGMYISKQVAQDGQKGPLFIEVVAPIEDTPAYRAGIHAGDLITKIGDHTTADMTVDDVVNQLRGAPGTDVTITIRRGENLEFPVTLKRSIIEVPTVKRDMISGKSAGGQRIGYLRIIQFTPHTAERVREAIQFFKDNNYTSMIIDLRNDPGGLLNGVIDTADEFFSDGLIVGTKSRVPTENQAFYATPGQMVPNSLPIAVLVDGGTASAAEIMAGALKDRGRGYLIGEKTYGKGSVQQVRNVGDGGFRLTMAKYYTPNGDFIDKKGIEPDKVVKAPALTDEQQKAYVKVLNEQLVQNFVEKNPKPTDAQIAAFIADLKSQGIDLDARTIRYLVKSEVARLTSTPIVYDLDYDVVLQDAVKMLAGNEIHPTVHEALPAVR